MKNTIFAVALILTMIGLAEIVRSQMPTGGSFTLEKAVVAGGGGASSGSGFSVNGTAGQTITERSSNNGFLISSGFWQSEFVPTAASVSISGRILTTDGRGLRNAVISLTDHFGATRTTLSSSFGYYRFDDIEAGQTVILTVRSKLYQFAPQVVSVSDNITGLDLTPLP